MTQGKSPSPMPEPDFARVQRILHATDIARLRDNERLRGQGVDPSDVIFDIVQKADISLYGGDRGTAERRQHGRLVEEGTGERHNRDLNSSPIIRYHEGGLLSACPYKHLKAEENQARFEAAQRLLGAWEACGQQPRMTANLMSTGGGAGGRIGGFARWRPYLDAHKGMGRYAALVQAVICYEQPPGAWVRLAGGGVGRAKSAGLGMELLRSGLARLVEYYRIFDRDNPRDR